MKKSVLMNTCLMLAFGFLIPAFALAQAPENKFTAQRLNDQAVVEINKQNFGAAIPLLKEALQLQPNCATAYYNLCSALYFSGDNGSAIAALKKATTLAPDEGKFYDQLGVVYADSGDANQAVRAFKQAIKLRPNEPTAFYNLGCAYIRLKNFAAAVTALERAVELEPAHAEARVNLGFALSRLRQYEEAIEHIRVAVKLNPSDNEVQFFLGNLYLLANDRTAAVAQCEILKTAEPRLAQALYLAINDRKVINAEYAKR